MYMTLVNVFKNSVVTLPVLLLQNGFQGDYISQHATSPFDSS